MRGIDSEYGITYRRIIQYHARNDKFTHHSLPALCEKNPPLLMFFICERLLSQNDSLFQGALPDIIGAFPL